MNNDAELPIELGINHLSVNQACTVDLKQSNINNNAVLSTKDELLNNIKNFVNEIEDESKVNSDVLKNMLKEILKTNKNDFKDSSHHKIRDND